MRLKRNIWRDLDKEHLVGILKTGRQNSTGSSPIDRLNQGRQRDRST